MEAVEREHLPSPGVAGVWEEFFRKSPEPGSEDVVSGMRYRGTDGNKFLVHEGCAHVLLEVPIAKKHPENPRKGDVPMIRESLRYHGQFDNVIINRGTYSKRYEPWTIGAGNHTFTGIEEEGWTHFGAQIVDDDELDRIMLMHNAASDSAYYDEDSLIGVTERLEDLDGTGISPDWMKSVIAKRNRESAGGPTEFPKFDDSDAPDHSCPKCGYEW